MAKSLPFTNLGKSCMIEHAPVANFNVADMSFNMFNAISEIKILAIFLNLHYCHLLI